MLEFSTATFQPPERPLKNALPVANEAFQDLVRTSFSNGQISIENKSYLFKQRYLFLREQAELRFEQQSLHAKTVDKGIPDKLRRGSKSQARFGKG